MYGLKEMLQKEQVRLETWIRQAKTGLESMPEGHLRISREKARVRYYHCKEDSLGEYIARGDDELPRQLAQKTYYLTVVRKAETRRKQIIKLLNGYSDSEMERLYTSLNSERKKLVTPLEPTWEQELEEWSKEEYHGKEFQEGTAVILTERGERVRSKSEKILADCFFRRNIPYQYEKPLSLKGYGIVYPDFTFLSPRDKKEIYWEHEGMMDKQDHARTAVRKLEAYQRNGIFPRERLILTFETDQCVLNTGIMEELVNRYLIC